MSNLSAKSAVFKSRTKVADDGLMKGQTRTFILALGLLTILTNCGENLPGNGQVPVDQAGQNLPGPSPSPGTSPAPVPLPGPVDSKVAPARWEANSPYFRNWTVQAYLSMETDGLDLLAKVPSDIADFCPRYTSLDRSDKKNFWVYLLSGIAQFESNFNTNATYTESFTDSTGQRVVSRGLLQLSFESALAYGCPLTSANDLHDPLINLQCGIKILNRWVASDGVIRADQNGWRGGARYWAVLRTTSQYNSIRNWSKTQTYCH